MTRHVVLALLCFGASISHADGMLPGGATIKFNRLFLHEDNNKDLAEPKKNPDSLYHTFNYAHCVCSQFNYTADTGDPSFYDKTFSYELLLQNQTSPIHRPLEIWVGSECNTTDVVVRNQKCRQVTTITDIASIQTTNGVKPEVPFYDLLEPEAMRQGCQERALNATEWAIADGDGDGTPDYFESKAIETDTQPPDISQLSAFKATGAENAIVISWKPPAAGIADVAYYQALCATSLGGPAKTSPPPARYITPYRLCGQGGDITYKPVDISMSSPHAADGGIDADVDADIDAASDAQGTLDLPEGLTHLDPAYVCAETADATATSLRIDGLKNGDAYFVMFIAVDKYGNANGVYFNALLTPQPVTDFWEDLHDRGSQVEGGFCLLAQTYGDDNPLTNTLRAFRDRTLGDTAFGRWLVDVYYGTIGGIDLHHSWSLRIVAGVLLLPLVAIALLWHWLTLPGLLVLVILSFLARQHRRALKSRLVMASTIVALILLAGRAAHAQRPYWDESVPTTASEEELPPGDPGRVKWHAGLRLGPYVPGIDAQLGMPAAGSAGPYEAMFGGYSILPMLDVDRFLWHGFGQLGVGVSIGYMSKSAKAWQIGSSASDPMRPRSSGDENTFRMFPLSANAVYRASFLDDEYGIPLVPYVRGGVGYYVWWIKAPNGDFAESCVGPQTDGCPKTTAAGASLGLVGSVGLAIRAERVDASAAASMREGGIEHAGFYGEYSVGWVDGFGSAKKLALGDNTWFAGIDFEF